MRPVFKKFKNVVLTGNCLQPIDSLPKIMDFKPRGRSFKMLMSRTTFGPYVMTKGADQLDVCSKHDQRENTGVVRNYGSLMVEMSSITPDGIICFFPSYKYMEFVIVKWNESGILQRILDNKLIFVETRDPLQTLIQLTKFK
jgi:DNA excision repair protein ERCC-2